VVLVVARKNAGGKTKRTCQNFWMGLDISIETRLAADTPRTAPPMLPPVAAPAEARRMEAIF
jgi:hypothetical protein